MERGLAIFEEEDALDRVGIALLLFLGLLSLGGMALADLGLFKGPFLLGVGAFSIAVGVWALVAQRLKAPPIGDILGLGTVLALVVFLFFPPAQFILGGWDAGAYLNTGISLAQKGSFVHGDGYLAQVLPGFRTAFVLDNPLGHNYLMPGFYVGDGDGNIYPQFPMFLSLWIALFALLGGPGLALYVAPIIGVLGVAYFYLLVRRALGRGVALAAALLLVANGVQIWHAKLTLSEELVQLALFGGLLAGVLYIKNPRILYALAAGVSLGALPLVKTEAVFLSLAAMGALYLLCINFEVSRKRWLAAAYLGAALLSALHYLTVSFFYVWDQLLASGGYLALGIILIMVGFLALVFALTGPFKAPKVLLRANGKALALSMAPVTLLGWAGLAVVEGDIKAPLGLAGSLWMGSFLSPLETGLLALGTLLVLVMGKPKVSLAGAAVLLILGLGGVLYLSVYFNHYQAKDEIPMYMWATRRLVPVLVPLMSIGVAWVLVRLAQALPGNEPVRGLPKGYFILIPAIMLVMASRLPDTWALVKHQEYQGAIEQVKALADMVPGDAVVVFQGDHPGIRLSTPLRFIFNRSAYVFWNPRNGALGLDSLIKAAGSQNKEVYYAASGPGPWASKFFQYNPESVGEVEVSLPEWERVSEGRPKEAGRFIATFTVFRLRGDIAPPSRPSTVFVDVGREDFLGYSLLRRGFYGKEESPQGTTYRWTSQRASLAVPQNLVGPLILRARIAGARPLPAPPAELTAVCMGKVLGEFPIENDFAVYSFEVSGECGVAGERNITLLFNGWSPAAYGMGNDRRALGAMVDWIEFAPAP